MRITNTEASERRDDEDGEKLPIEMKSINFNVSKMPLGRLYPPTYSTTESVTLSLLYCG